VEPLKIRLLKKVKIIYVIFISIMKVMCASDLTVPAMQTGIKFSDRCQYHARSSLDKSTTRTGLYSWHSIHHRSLYPTQSVPQHLLTLFEYWFLVWSWTINISEFERLNDDNVEMAEHRRAEWQTIAKRWITSNWIFAKPTTHFEGYLTKSIIAEDRLSILISQIDQLPNVHGIS
jgi:hypothetical protein